MKTIKQTAEFDVSPHDVFEALMDSKKHTKFSGEKAVISRKVGGKFMAYGGHIEGKNLKITPDKIIIQVWRGTDWPKGVFSKVTYKITKTENGSKLNFTQTGVPDDQYKSINQGWIDYYWKPMNKMFKMIAV